IHEYHRRVLGAPDHASAMLTQRNDSSRKERIFQSVSLLDDDEQPTRFIPLGGSFRVRIELHAPRQIEYPAITLGIDDTMGQRLLSLVTPLSRPVLERLDGPCAIECSVESFPLAPGEYWLKLGLAAADVCLDDIERALHFTVTNADAFGEGRGIHRGLCVAPSTWRRRDGDCKPFDVTRTE